VRTAKFVAAVVLVGAAVLPVPAGAAGTRSVVATASAQAVRVTYTMPDYVAVATLFDGGGPVSEATGDSTGRAVTFASLPYPGETAVFFPGVMAAATGVQPPSGYPFYARADYPTTPKSEVFDPSGTYTLRAEADRGKADGSAAFQFIGESTDAVSRSAAGTHFTLDDRGNATVVAETENWGLSLGGGALTIASVRSRSTSTYTQGSDKPAVTRELLIDGARAFKQAVTIGPDGVHTAGQTAPAPFGAGTKSLNDALKQSGISVRTVSESGDGSGSADLLEITSHHPVPLPGNPQGTLTWRFGAVTTGINLGPASDSDADGDGAAPPGGSSTADGNAAAAGSGAGPAPDGSDGSGAGNGTAAGNGTGPAADGSAAGNGAGSAGDDGAGTGAERAPASASLYGAGASLSTSPSSGGGGSGPTSASNGAAERAALGSTGAGSTTAGVRRGGPQAVVLQRTFRVGGRLELLYGLLGLSALLLVLSPGVWRLTRLTTSKGAEQ
jgi:hypothetical protein